MAQIILDSNNNLIQGDFDNATLNNRTKLQTTTTNATTNVYVVPNGSATSAGVSVSNAADPTNASKIVMATNGSTDTQLISGVNGSGSYLPLSFYTNNALAAQLTTAGNLTVTGTIASTGKVTTASLATGTASASTYLRGDQTWATISSTPTTAQVLSATAGATVGDVGTYSLLYNTLANNPGTTRSSGLSYSNCAGDVNGSPSGTWQCMAYSYGGGTTKQVTVWLRIS